MFAGKARKSARNEAYLWYAATTKDAAQALHADFLRSRLTRNLKKTSRYLKRHLEAGYAILPMNFKDKSMN
jgi:hypothetical protein